MKNSFIIEIISLVFVVLFLYTGISKWMDFPIFREQIGMSPLFAHIKGFAAFVLPLIEIIVAIILFVPKTKIIGLYASLGLMILFTGYVIYILNFNEHLPCTCGGILQSLSWRQHLIVNVALLILAGWSILIVRNSKKRKSDVIQVSI